MRGSSLTICFLLLSASAAGQESPRLRPPREGPPKINVIYPVPGAEMGPVDSTFIVGSVNPGSKLRVNGASVPVYRTGGFLAWVAVEPGAFVFRLRAQNGEGKDSLDLPVKIGDDRPIPASAGAQLREGSLRPLWNRTIRSGDEVSVSFDGTIGGKARFWVAGGKDKLGPFPMTELYSRSLADYEAYRRDEMLVPDSILSAVGSPARGRYHGLWQVPAGLEADTLSVIVELSVRSPKLESIQDTVGGLLIPVDRAPARVIELADSTQILRTGPRLGYFAINQPFGVRARWWGTNGPWTIIQPAAGYEAWIETEKTRLLPEGTPLPGTVIPRLNTVTTGRSVRLEIGTTERLAFNVSVDSELQRASILIFGAVSNTDWIEQDTADRLLTNIIWSQEDPQVYRVDVALSEPLWGYDARYEGTKLIWEFIRSPVHDTTLDGLRICVDPGHSADAGSIGPTGLKEKDANLRIARALATALEAGGARIIMTREGDEDVPLLSRPAIAVRDSADIYISVHNNAVGDGINPNYRNGTGTYFHHPHSRDLAEAVHKQVRKATGLPDYGLTQANFAVIRPSQYPSVLVECAFMIIPEQEELLDNDAFVTRTAHGIANGIHEFVKGQYRK